jgi:hypothetical protein
MESLRTIRTGFLASCVTDRDELDCYPSGFLRILRVQAVRLYQKSFNTEGTEKAEKTKHENYWAQLLQAAEKAPSFFVIPSEARNLSFFLWG